MDTLPPEIFDIIASQAFVDGGRTVCTIRILAKRYVALTRPYRFHTVSLVGSAHMRLFADVLAATSVDSRIVRHLFLSDGPSNTAKDAFVNQNSSQRGHVALKGILRRSEDSPEILLVRLLRRLSDMCAPSLQTIHIHACRNPRLVDYWLGSGMSIHAPLSSLTIVSIVEGTKLPWDLVHRTPNLQRLVMGKFPCLQFSTNDLVQFHGINANHRPVPEIHLEGTPDFAMLHFLERYLRYFDYKARPYTPTGQLQKIHIWPLHDPTLSFAWRIACRDVLAELPEAVERAVVSERPERRVRRP
jgi:hypothetical protein